MLPFPNQYCNLTPTAKQQSFLDLETLEVFFGGAAGGGKSIALLMAALQYVDQPGYAALILRKDTQRLSLAGGLIPRSHEWLTNTDARWNEARRTWTFPCQGGGFATLTFGYLARPDDKYRYLSSEFQYIAFDELTELTEDDYTYLFSRLRRPKLLSHVPLRIRSASNPGGRGHLWVKERFIRDESSKFNVQGSNSDASTLNVEPGTLNSSDRIFLPSRIEDNKYLDADEYRQSLMHLMPITRERLLNGDWSVQENGVFKPEWIRYYLLSGDQFELLHRDRSLFVVIPQNACRFFITVDPAGTSEEGGETSASRSFSVIQVWAQPKSRELSHLLILRDQIREQCSLQALGKRIQGVQTTWKTERIWIEDEKLGHGLVADLKKVKPPLPVEVIRTHCKSKQARAVPLANKMERGEVFLPENNASWRPGFERELLAWTGDKRERSDQIDAAAYAAIIAEQQTPGVFVMQHIAH